MSTPNDGTPSVTVDGVRDKPSGPRRSVPGTHWAGWAPLVLAILFAAVTALVVTGAVQPADDWVVRSVRPGDVWGESQVRWSPWMHWLRPVVMYGALACTCLVVAARRRSWRPVLFCLCLGAVSATLVLVVKLAVARRDPHGALASTGGGYPSGHVVAVLVCLGGCLLVLGPGLRWWWWAIPAVGVGLMTTSLIVSAAHWPSDVVGGGLLALAVVSAAGHLSVSRWLAS